MVSPQATSLTPETHSNAAPGAPEQPREHPQAERTRTKAREAWTSVSTPIRGASSKLKKPRWGTHNQRPTKIAIGADPRLPIPAQQRPAAAQRAPRGHARPLCCASVSCCVNKSAARKSTTKQKTHTPACCLHFFISLQAATQTKKTNAVSAKSHTRPLSIAPLDPAVAVAAPSRTYALERVPRAADLAPAPRHPPLPPAPARVGGSVAPQTQQHRRRLQSATRSATHTHTTVRACSHDIWRAHTPVTSERARFCAAVRALPRRHANHRTQEGACTPRGDHDQESGSRTCRDECAGRARSWSRIASEQPSGLRGSGDRTRATTNRDARSARRIGTEAVAPPDVPARYKTLPSPYRADQVHRRCPSHRAERPLADLEARNVLRVTASKDAWCRCPQGVQRSRTQMTPDRGEAARVAPRP